MRIGTKTKVTVFSFWKGKTTTIIIINLQIYLITLAVVLQAARTLAVTAFCVTSFYIALFPAANFRPKSPWIPVQTSLGAIHIMYNKLMSGIKSFMLM